MRKFRDLRKMYLANFVLQFGWFSYNKEISLPYSYYYMNFKDIQLHILILLEKSSNKSFINLMYLNDYLDSSCYMFKSEI